MVETASQGVTLHYDNVNIGISRRWYVDVVYQGSMLQVSYVQFTMIKLILLQQTYQLYKLHVL